MLSIRILPHKHLWWYDPELPKKKKGPGRIARSKQVTESVGYKALHKGNLDFQHSKRWKRYVDLNSYDGGYIVEMYSLKEVAKRYGLSTGGKEYWRNNILPEPFLLPRNNVRMFYWSRIQLTVVDTVLRHLEENGFLTIRKSYTSCLELIDHGSQFLEDFYKKKYEEQTLTPYDSFGVRKIEF